jgi:hypothetical protein
MPVGAQNCALAAGCDAPIYMRDRGLVMLAEDFRFHSINL